MTQERVMDGAPGALRGFRVCGTLNWDRLFATNLLRCFRLAADKSSKKTRVLPFPKKGIDLPGGKVFNIDINASSAGRPAALSEDDLRVRVQRIVCYGTVRESWHSKNDRSYRNISIDDIQHMLRSEWKLVGKPKWSDEHHNWAYKLNGEDLDDDELTLILSVHEDEIEILIITKY